MQASVTEPEKLFSDVRLKLVLAVLPVTAVARVDYIGLRKLLRKVFAPEIMPLPTS